MSTLGTVGTRIANELKRGDITGHATVVFSAVVAAIQFYERRRFTWNEFSGVVKTTVASTTAVTLSIQSVTGGIVSIDSVKAVIGSRDYPLTRRQWVELDRMDSGQFYGYPEHYAIHSNEFRMYPPPAAAYVLRFSGIKKLPEVSLGAAETATNAWVDFGQGGNLITLKAKSIIFRDTLRAPNFAQQFDKEAEREFREISRETREKQSSGRVIPSRW